jgi:hypothetical protein
VPKADIQAAAGYDLLVCLGRCSADSSLHRAMGAACYRQFIHCKSGESTPGAMQSQTLSPSEPTPTAFLRLGSIFPHLGRAAFLIISAAQLS